MPDTTSSTVGHPITSQTQAWELREFTAWMSAADPEGNYPVTDGPFVVLESWTGGVVTVPRDALTALATGLLAAHVDAARADKWT